MHVAKECLLFLFQLRLCLASCESPLHHTSPIPPPSQQSGSLNTAVQEGPSGSLIRLWSVHSRGRGWWDQMAEWATATKRKALRVRQQWESPERSDAAFKVADLFGWLYLTAGNLQQNGWYVTFKCIHGATVRGCPVGSGIKCGSSWSGLPSHWCLSEFFTYRRLLVEGGSLNLKFGLELFETIPRCYIGHIAPSICDLSLGSCCLRNAPRSPQSTNGTVVELCLWWKRCGDVCLFAVVW